ncbi:putative tetratricopeptide-like helical domain superfamily [Dioscorea sansibarensis]
MVLIEQEPDDAKEQSRSGPSTGAVVPGADSSDEESFEDALNEEQLLEKARNQVNDAKIEGNRLFGSGQYEDALSKYELALQLASEVPDSEEIRSMCHANRAICFLKLQKYDDTIKECTEALELNPSYVKALLRRAEAHEKLDHLEEAIADMKKIMELEPSNDQARRTIQRLEPILAEKREKLKEEMIGKLKEMGNSVLGRFGMSVDNFKAVKDPNTGSYSISFQR